MYFFRRRGGSSYPLHELESLDADTKTELGIKINDHRLTEEWIEKKSISMGFNQGRGKEKASSIKLIQGIS